MRSQAIPGPPFRPAGARLRANEGAVPRAVVRALFQVGVPDADLNGEVVANTTDVFTEPFAPQLLA
jgi:hypothetical protein